jgi:hypothetical protein
MTSPLAWLKTFFGRYADAHPPHGGPRFDWLMTVLGFWFVTGVFVDGWAHNHLDSALESFFTPWHALLYSGFTACAFALAWTAWKHRAPGRKIWRSVPEGYGSSLIGAGIFAAGGGGDMVWHLTFGIEKNIEALLSPTHLLLATGAVLIMTGPLRAMWALSSDGHRLRLRTMLPAILAMTFSVSVLSFMTQFAHPIDADAAGMIPATARAMHESQSLSIAGMLLQIAFLMGFALLAVRRWGSRLPFGTFTIIFGLNAYGMSLMTDQHRLVWAAVAAGLLADANLAKLEPSAERRGAYRIFAAATPMTYFITYFLALMATGRVWWSVHMWTGAIVMAGMIGLLMSWLVLPPPSPEER